MDAKSPSETLRLFEETWEEAQKAFLAAQDEFADKLANARQTLRSCAGNVEKHRSVIEQLAESARTHVAELRTAIDAPSANLELEEKLKAAEAAVAERDTEIGLLKEAGNALEERVRLAEQRAHTLEDELKQAQEQVAAKSAQLADVEVLRTELDAAKAAETALNQRAGQAEADLAEARKRLEEAERELSAAEQACGPLKEEAESLRAQLAAAAQKAEATDEEVVRLRNEVARVMSELEAATAGSSTAQSAIEAAKVEAEQALRAQELLQAEARAAIEAADAAKAEAEECRQRAALAEDKLRDELARGTKSALATQLAEALREAEEAKEELRALRAERGASPAHATESERSAAENVSGRSAAEELQALLAAVKQAKGQKRSIGELLIEAEIVTREQVAQAVDEQRRRPQTHLGAIFIEKGWASEEAVAQALAYQCGAHYVNLSEDSLDSAAATLISERLANQHVCIPLRASDDSVTLAMANPLDLVAIEDIERATSRKVEVMVSTGKQIREAIGKYYWEP